MMAKLDHLKVGQRAEGRRDRGQELSARAGSNVFKVVRNGTASASKVKPVNELIKRLRRV